LTFKEDNNTKKRTFALHGHGSAPDDPTISLAEQLPGRLYATVPLASPEHATVLVKYGLTTHFQYVVNMSWKT